MYLWTVFLLCSLFMCVPESSVAAGSEYDRLWFNYEKTTLTENYGENGKMIKLSGSSFDGIIKKELDEFFVEVYGISPEYNGKNAGIVMSREKRDAIGRNGFVISCKDGMISIKASDDAGFLYGTYAMIRMLRTGRMHEGLVKKDIPVIERRLIDHWDNMNGRIERGYAGSSIWKWEELPGTLSPRYEAYARANASIGINGLVINNVNASPQYLKPENLEKIAALAGVFRKYNIRLYLSINFGSPMKPVKNARSAKEGGGIGTLETADPLDPEVIAWWKEKVKEIYRYIPDFGGFLVKANSEGMPGPQTYDRTHADGANMLARALKPYGGIVMWRAFVYFAKVKDPDRMKQAYLEFMPMDGKFEDNVILQIKNGSLDFQPSEPAAPLFGAMKQTPVMAEMQITQEYLGHSTYLVYLLPMWRKFLDFDTRCKATPGCTVSRILQGKVWPQKLTAIAGVGNVGDDYNWTGHYFAQANWYAFGRLAWNPDNSDEEITEEWIMQTWNSGARTTETIKRMMDGSWESFMKSSSPYGLGMTSNAAHYKADFERRNRSKVWTADERGVGYDRTTSGSDYVSQFFEPNRTVFNELDLCPEELMLCFHFVKWDHIMPDGRQFREFFMDNLKAGLRKVDFNLRMWESIASEIDKVRYDAVRSRLLQEQKDAQTFYDAAFTFFSRYADK